METHREKQSWRKSIPGMNWGDAMMIARKPALSDDAACRFFYDRLNTIFGDPVLESERHPQNRIVGPAGFSTSRRTRWL